MSEPAEDREIGKILFTQHEIERRVMELGKEISNAYRGVPLTVIGVLKGAVFFLADLVRVIDGAICYDFYQISSYGAGTSPQGPPAILLTSSTPLTDRHVLLVEDIVDTGETLCTLREVVLRQKPHSVRICALLDKRERRVVEVPLDWVGFTIPNRFVVGYGLDHNERYRNLPYLAFLREPWD